jgi:hypothetical protein
MTDFDIYCRNKSPEDRMSLLPIRDLILSISPELGEFRAHFYLVYHIGSVVVVKLHLNAKQQPQLTFLNGSDLVDERKLLKGKSLSRQVTISGPAYFEKNKDFIRDLLVQSFELMKSRWDGVSQIAERDKLRPDQPSP